MDFSKKERVRSVLYGFPSFGKSGELFGLIKDLKLKKISEDDFFLGCKKIRLENWETQKKLGLDVLPVNDFSVFDQIFDALVLCGCIPSRFYWEGGVVGEQIRMYMAYGQQQDKFDISPLSFETFFDTKRKCCIPEITDDIPPINYSDNKHVVHLLELKGITNSDQTVFFTGPLTMCLWRYDEDSFAFDSVFDFLKDVFYVFLNALRNMERVGCKKVCFEERICCFDLKKDDLLGFIDFYNNIKESMPNIDITISFPSGLSKQVSDRMLDLKVDRIHINTQKQDEESLFDLAEKISSSKKSISLGVVDADSYYVSNLERSLKVCDVFLNKVKKSNIELSTTAPIFNVPTCFNEKDCDPKVKELVSFADGKVKELVSLCRIINGEKTNEDDLVFKRSNSGFKKITGIFDSISKKKDFGCKNKKEKKQTIYSQKDTPFFFGKQCLVDDQKEIDCVKSIIESQDDIKCSYSSIYPYKKNEASSFFLEDFDGVFVAKNSMIQKKCDQFVFPAIIYDVPKSKKNKFQDRVSVCKKSKKDLVVYVPGPHSIARDCGFVDGFDSSDFVCFWASELNKKISSCGVQKKEKTIFCFNESDLFSSFFENKAARKNTFTDRVREAMLVSRSGLDSEFWIYIEDSSNPMLVDDLNSFEFDNTIICVNKVDKLLHESMFGYNYSSSVTVCLFDGETDRVPSHYEIGKRAVKALRYLEREKVLFSSKGYLSEILAKNKKTISSTVEKIVREVKESMFSDN